MLVLAHQLSAGLAQTLVVGLGDAVAADLEHRAAGTLDAEDVHDAGPAVVAGAARLDRRAVTGLELLDAESDHSERGVAEADLLEGVDPAGILGRGLSRRLHGFHSARTQGPCKANLLLYSKLGL